MLSRKIGILVLAVLALAAAPSIFAQATTGTILGSVLDDQHGAMAGVTVTVRNVDTNTSRTTTTNSEGRYRVPNLPVGNYEVTAELAGFSKHVRTGVTLAVNQDAVVDVALQTAARAETVTVTADAPLVNSTTPEVGVRFDTKRVSELPITTTRNIFQLALSAPGVAQLSQGQSEFTSGVQFSVNGMRTRGNNFMLDGQDTNDPSIGGRIQPMNNPDVVQEVRLITNQFAAEHGRNAGSIMNVITKSGTNSLHGSAFWFDNRCGQKGEQTGGICMNARNNLDKAADRAAATAAGQTFEDFKRDRYRREQQYGVTLGGPVVKSKTFFFGAYQHWIDNQLGSGTTLNGAPTEAGRAILQQVAGNRPHVAALLDFLPAAQSPIGKDAVITIGGQTYTIPLGSLTNETTQEFESDQAMGRLDHHFSSNHILSARYLFAKSTETGGGQVTPPGNGTVVTAKQQSGSAWLTSILSGSAVNEFRFGWQRLNTNTGSANPDSETIPSIEIAELGLTGFNAAVSRTGIGLAVNLPQFRNNDTYQFQDTFSITRGKHSWKAGFDFRKTKVESFFVPTIRGQLQYSTLQRFVDDVALLARINAPLPGGQEIQNYDWWDYYAFIQDEWRVRDSLTLTLGLRYETPGNSIAPLFAVNDRIVDAAGGDQRYALTPKPKRDVNNFQPRVGFNWNPRTSGEGFFGWLTGGDKLVVRGGYARTNDYAFININLNIASAFPFVAAVDLPATSQPTGGVGVSDAFARIPAVVPSGLNPLTLTRTVVREDFRAPSADQFSLDLQRQIGQDVVFRIGYVGTKGNDLFQSIEANPTVPFSNPLVRQDPTRGIIRMRANTASSIYHSLQTSIEKRLGKGFSGGLHYTWSAFIDDASEIFNAATSGDVATPQDPYDPDNDRARSSYDRPHRLAGNVVYELPMFRDQRGFLGKLLGGWQASAAFSIQSGAPFTVLNGADPTGVLSGSLVGQAIRPNLNTDLDLSNMTIQEILDAGGASLFKPLCGYQSATCPGERVGNVGRNTLRADGIENLDLAFIKTTRISGDHRFQLWIQMFNALNHRNFGIPESRINSANFLNEKGTDGGRRRIIVALRYIF